MKFVNFTVTVLGEKKNKKNEILLFLNFSWSQLCCSCCNEHDLMLFYEEKNSVKSSKLRHELRDQSKAFEEGFEENFNKYFSNP